MQSKVPLNGSFGMGLRGQDLRPSWKVRLSLLFLVLFSLAGAVSQAYPALRSAAYVVVKAQRRVSEAEVLEQRFAPLRSQLPTYGEVGYLARLELDDATLERRFMVVGYLLAPLRLTKGAEPALVVADVDAPEDVEVLCRQYGLVPLVVVEHGPALLTHSSN